MASTSNDQTAHEVNQELTSALSSAAQRFGFTAVCEYPVKGGRIDVVWTWSPQSPIPGVEGDIPVVGFEIESSWRTRKHVKGDLLNLQDAGVALGVIVLAGDSEKDESLRKFAAQLVDRPGPKVLIWTTQDVRSLADASPRPTHQKPDSPAGIAETVSPSTSNSPAGSQLAAASHAGKYAPLHRWLLRQERASVSVTFAEVEEILGFPLPNSCRDHVAHWHSYDGSAVARAIIDAGWRSSRVSLVNQTVTLTRADH